MDRIRNTNKILMFVLAVFMFMPCMLLLSACGGDNNNNNDNEPTVMFVTATYNGQAYAFDTTNGSANIEYSSNLTFPASDFSAVLHMSDGTNRTITSSDFTFTIYKTSGGADVVATEFLPGAYRIEIAYTSDPTLKGILTFRINEIPLTQNNVTVTNFAQSYTYSNNSAGVRPEPTFTYNNTVLVEGVDYYLTYGSNDAVGNNTGSITFTAMGMYSGTFDLHFAITAQTPGQFPGNKFVNVTTTYNGNDQSDLWVIDYSVEANKVEGVTEINYAYKNENQQEVYSWEMRNVGVYTATVSFVMETGYAQLQQRTFTITINPYDIANVDLSSYLQDDIECEYKFRAFSESDFSGDVSNIMYNVCIQDLGLNSVIEYDLSMTPNSETIDNTNISTATKHGQFEITPKATETNFTGKLLVPFTITPADIDYAWVDNGNNGSYFVYDGTPQTVAVYYYVSNGTGGGEYRNLELNTDYSIEYEGNTNAGEATYTITGLGVFSGTTKSGSFTISKAEINPYNLYNWNFNGTNFVYDGTDQTAALSQYLHENLDNTIAHLDDIFNCNVVAQVWKDYTDANGDDPDPDPNDDITGHFITVPFMDASYGYKPTAIFTLKDANNYKFPDDWDMETGETIPQTSYSLSYDNYVSMRRAIATLTYTGASTYEFTGGIVGPTTDDVSVEWGTQPLSLGTDFTVSIPNSINVRHGYGDSDSYSVVVSLINGNFVFGDDWGYTTNDLYKYYSITPKVLTPEDLTITWPTVHKHIWSSYYYIAEEDATGTILANTTTELNVEFYCFNGTIPGTSTQGTHLRLSLQGNDIYNYALKMSNAQNASNYVPYELIRNATLALENPFFASITINGGEPLTTQQIEALTTTGLSYGDSVNIVANDNFNMDYYVSASGNERLQQGVTSVTFTVGQAQGYDVDDIHEVMIHVRSDDINYGGYSYEYAKDEAYGYIPVNRIVLTAALDKEYDGQAVNPQYTNCIPNSYVDLNYYQFVGNTNKEGIAGAPSDSGRYSVMFIVKDNTSNNEVYRLEKNFTITPATTTDPLYQNSDVEALQAVAMNVGNYVSNIVLPEGWSWNEGNPTILTTAGNQTLHFVFTSGNSRNLVDVAINVGKGTPTLTHGSYTGTKQYDGHAYNSNDNSDISSIYTTSDADVIIEYKVRDADDLTYTTAAPINAGLYTFRLRVVATNNYNAYATDGVDFEIAKVTPQTPRLTALFKNGKDYTGMTLADVVLPVGWSWIDSTQAISSATFSSAASYEGTDNYNAVDEEQIEVQLYQLYFNEQNTDQTIILGYYKTYYQNGSHEYYIQAITDMVNYWGEPSTITYYYKSSGADDSTYTTDLPTEVGVYVVKAYCDGFVITTTLTLVAGEEQYTYTDTYNHKLYSFLSISQLNTEIIACVVYDTKTNAIIDRYTAEVQDDTIIYLWEGNNQEKVFEIVDEGIVPYDAGDICYYCIYVNTLIPNQDPDITIYTCLKFNQKGNTNIVLEYEERYSSTAGAPTDHYNFYSGFAVLSGVTWQLDEQNNQVILGMVDAQGQNFEVYERYNIVDNGEGYLPSLELVA